MTTDWLYPVCNVKKELIREANRRKKGVQLENVNKNIVSEYIDKGWVIDRELKNSVRIKKDISHDALLENRVWLLFYYMQYPEISSGRNFQINICRKGGDAFKKQIDVLAKDDETVIVSECKSSATITKKSLQKDIEEFASLQKPIANAIRKHYGTCYNPKIIWLFVTHNIVWSENDRSRANGNNINIVTETELRYYQEIADHLRSAARYQFLAEFLKNQKIPALDNIKVPAIKGKIGGKVFYSFVSTPKQMLKISFVNHRSLNDPAGAPSYQRLIKRNRLKQISQFLSQGGYFPTNILVNFNTVKCRYENIQHDEETNVSFGYLYLPNYYRSAWVIDGQHRLFSYAQLSEKKLNENIMVVAFENMTPQEEANLFVTINHEQKSVPKTLLDDLEGDLNWGSDDPVDRINAISSRLIKLLNNDIGEPFYRRITQEGIPATDKMCLTIPALKSGLVKSGLLGTSVLSNSNFELGPLSSTDDNGTLQRARSFLNTFFEYLKNANPFQWESGRKGSVCINVSIQAYLRLLNDIIKYMTTNKSINPIEILPSDLISEIEDYIDPIIKYLTDTSPSQIDKDFKVPYGAGGPPEYYYRLCRIINSSFTDFSPKGLNDWIDEQSDDRISKANEQIAKINIIVQNKIVCVLKDIYGDKYYWEKGITDKTIKEKAYSRSIEDDIEERLEPEHYIDFLDYKKIVENKAHWERFKPFFDIPEPGIKGVSKNIKWMETINALRRIPAHPTDKRKYKSDDFEYIDFIHNELFIRINSGVSINE